MKKILVLALMLTGLNAMANHHEGDFNHMIEFNTNAFGFDYSSQTVEINNSDVDATTLEFVVNYAHKISHNFWLQGILGFETTNTEATGTDEDETSIGLILAAIYNFDHDETNSFYGKLGYSFQIAEEDDNAASTTEEIDANQVFIEFGKRWSLEKLTGIKNISYVASIAYGMGSGDFDQGGTSTDIDVNGFVIQLLGINVFF